MKKMFSLVLALVMALSLTTVAFGAATEVTTAEELATALTADVETISVVLQDNIDLPIRYLGSITSGSGEYKLGGESTKNIVIDLNGNTLNITTTYWSAIGAKNADATITIKNGSMTSTGNSAGTWNAWDVRLCNCNYVIEDVTFEKAVALDNAGKTTKMTNVTINENSGDKYALWITAEGQTVEIDGLTINSSTGRGIKIDEQYVDASAKVTLDVSNAEFNTAKKSAIMVKSAAGADITASDCDISGVAEDSTNLVWVDEDAAAYANLVSVTGATGIVEGQPVTPETPTTVVGNKGTLYSADGLKTKTAEAEDFVYTPAKALSKSVAEGNVAYYTSATAGEGNVWMVVGAADALNTDSILKIGGTEKYVRAVAAADVYYVAVATEYKNIGEKCGQIVDDGFGTKYYTLKDNEGKAVDGYFVEGSEGNVLLGTAVVGMATADPAIVAHEWEEAAYDKDGYCNALKCANCPATAKLYKTGTVPAGVKSEPSYYPVYELMVVKATTGTTAGTKVESAETFDAGIAMYVGMSVMAAAGSAVVLKKKD